MEHSTHIHLEKLKKKVFTEYKDKSLLPKLLMGKIIPTLHNLFQETEEEGTLLRHSRKPALP